MNKYIKFSSPFIFLLSFILILVFKTIPSGKLWKDYSVLCVPVSTDDSVVMAAINKSGIENTVTQSGQFLPISLSEDSIEISMLRLNYNSPAYSYINKRSLMFYDKSSTWRLYYIPARYSSEITEVMKQLKGQGIECTKDSSADYPWLLPVIALLLAVMLFLFVKHKVSFICGSIIPLIFLYSNPYYPVATAICLLLLCLFFVSNVWRRKGAVTSLWNNYSIPAMLGISLLCVFSSSLASGFLYLLALIGTTAALTACWYTEDFLRNRKPFVPVYIRSAKRVSIFAGKIFTIMNVVTGAVALFILLIFVTSSNSINNNSSKLLFPASAAITDSKLPQFEDYYKWNWNVKTYPYKSLNKSADINDAENETVQFSAFVENEETGIITEQVTTLKYDNSFKKEVYEGIDELKFDSVEKLMKSEGEGFSGGYTAASSYQINIFGIIMCFICLFILLFIYISIIIRKGINK